MISRQIQPIERPWSQVVNEYVSRAEQSRHGLDAGRGFDVELDAAFAAIEPNEGGGLSPDRRVKVARKVAPTRPLELNHVSAQVG
jgi:hypothetical protein